MPKRCHLVPAGRVYAVCAGVLALVAAVRVLDPAVPFDDASFGAGYLAASDRSLVRDALGWPGVTPATLCGNLYERDGAHDGLLRVDFVAGCTRGIGDVME
jgi:hypothetical protein